MMTLSRLLRTSCNVHKDLSARLALHAYNSHLGFSTAGHDNAPKDRFTVHYTVFKGKAALAMTPVLPTFTKRDQGFYTVDRKGCVMLKFFPAIGERKYDYEKKQIFALSPTEVGSVISMGPKDNCEFFHDPGMLSSISGQVRKSLSIKANPSGDGYFISLTVVNNLLKSRDNMNVPFSTAEFTVMKTACSYILPHILGWDQMTKNMGSPLDNEQAGSFSSPTNKYDRRSSPAEWEK